jgi:hypothetical protein
MNCYVKSNNQTAGQVLVALLVFMVIAITITSAAVTIVLVNSEAASKLESGEMALDVAESGAENSLMRLLRDPDYPGEVNLPVGQGFVDATVSGSTTKTIIATGKLGSFQRKIQVVASYNNNQLQVNSWKETP